MKVSQQALYAVPALMALAAVSLLFGAIWIDDGGRALKMVLTAILLGFITFPVAFLVDDYVDKG